MEGLRLSYAPAASMQTQGSGFVFAKRQARAGEALDLKVGRVRAHPWVPARPNGRGPGALPTYKGPGRVRRALS